MRNKFFMIMFVVACILSFYGFVFEYSYFKALDLVVTDYIGLKYFLVRGLITFLYFIIPIFLSSQLIKFFSISKLKKSDAESLKSIINNSNNFEMLISLARIVFVVCIFQWVIVFFDFNFPYTDGIGSLSGLLFMYCCSVFTLAILVAPETARITLATFFLVSLTLIVSSFGASLGKFDVEHISDNKVRNDITIKIIQTELKEYTVEVKPITLPIPFVKYFLKND